MKSSKPLLLLFSADAASVGTRLQNLIINDPTVFDYDGLQSSDSEFQLLYDGITFEAEVSDTVADIRYFNKIFYDNDVSHLRCAISLDLGKNVSGGEKIAQIAARLLSLGAYLAEKLDAQSLAWAPATVVTNVSYFSEAVKDYVSGGAFPVLATINFTFPENGLILKTDGLAWFSDQELELHGAGLSQPEIMRRAVRIVHDIAVNGAVTESVDLPDLENQNQLSLRPNNDQKLLVAEIRSNSKVIPL